MKKNKIYIDDKVTWKVKPGVVQTGVVIQFKKYPFDSVLIKTTDNKVVWIASSFIKKL